MTRDPALVALFRELAQPFDAREVKWKPQSVKGNRCLAIAYIDARIVQDRLDDVVGPENWEESYNVLPDGSVTCRLTVIIGERRVFKEDVGAMSEQPDAGDRLKSAFSDALKRAAVKYGIGRYLYRLANQWVDYDPVKKMIMKTPELPVWARPQAMKNTGPAQQPAAETNQQRDIRVALVKWAERMKGVGSAEDFTQFIPLLKEHSDSDVKLAVWDYIQEQAQDRGYEYIEKERRFVEGVNDNEPIPF